MSMKTRTKKLLFILILVISIMAILITASQIYDILDNEKVVDNNISGIDSDENKIEQINGTISNTYSIKLYEWDDSTPSSTELRDYLKYVGDENNNGQIEMHATLTESPRIPTGMIAAYHDYISCVIKFKVDKNVKIGKIYSCDSINHQFFLRDKENYTYRKTSYSKQVIQRYKFDYNGEDIYTVTIDRKPIMTYSQGVDVEGNMFFSSGWFFPNITFFLESEYIEPQSNNISYGNNPKISIENNELLQTTTTIDGKKLSQYNYEQITDEWGEGKELATIKCSIGEYYEYDEAADDHKGALAISTQNNDLPMIFNIGDLVIPYIAVANGQTEPLSLKLNGTPKVFKVTQIRPYFDGAFWQELTLQEHTK